MLINEIFFDIYYTNKYKFIICNSKKHISGGCFWCMEESFESLEGVEEVISGYSVVQKIQLIKR